MAAPVTINAILPVTESGPLSAPSNDAIVTATASFLGWQPAAAIGGVAQVSIEHSEMLAAFGIRNTLAKTPPDLIALGPVNLLTLKLTAACWGRILTRIRDAGAGIAAAGLTNVPELHDYIRQLPAVNPNPFLVQAVDWDLYPAFAIGGAAALRANLAKVRFLSLARIDSLEVQTGPLSTTAPWTFICKISGAMGPVGTQAARSRESSCLQSVAELIRANGIGGAADGSLALNLLPNLKRTSMPKFLKAHGATPGEQYDELADSFVYKMSEQDRVSVERKRIDLALPW